MIIEIIQAFMVKIMDNGLGTFKSIYLNKEKYFFGALFSAFSTYFYLIGVKQVTSDSGWLTIGVMTFATFVGTYWPGIFIRKIERDKLYIFEVTASSLEDGKKFADELRELNLAVKTTISYDSDMIKVLTCKVYCATKHESSMVNELIPEEFRYHVYVPIEY
jgi:hypothetical protein